VKIKQRLSKLKWRLDEMIVGFEKFFYLCGLLKQEKDEQNNTYRQLLYS
jgi:hypothetical protein